MAGVLAGRSQEHASLRVDVSDNAELSPLEVSKAVFTRCSQR